MNTSQIPAPEAGDTSGDKSPSFSPSARESASKRRERTVAWSGDTLRAGDDNPSQNLASASAVTADVTESREGAAESDRPVEEPHRPRPAPAAVSQHQAFPSFMRRYIDMAGASGPEMDQPRPLPEAHFVPRASRGSRTVAPSITPPPPPMAASVTGSATPVAGSATPVAGSTCPTCQCRVPARLTSAERQRAYRERKREKKEQHLSVAATVERITD
jgi:hypothetical protein